MTSPNFIIRDYTNEDKHLVHTMFVEGLSDFDAYKTREDDSDLKKISEHYFKRGGGFWILEVEGVVCGMVGLDCISKIEGAVRRMSVKRDFRGSGWGKRLLKHVEGEASSRGIKIIYLTTQNIQIPAMKMYDTNGYTLVRVEAQRLYYEKKI